MNLQFPKKYSYYIGVFILYLLLAYPLLYYSYKFYSPDFGGRDFYYYYPLYENFDITHTESPFNMRLVSSYLVYLFNQAGIHYDTYIQYTHKGIDKNIFFNAILVNWLAGVMTAFLIFQYIYECYFSIIGSILAGILYLFSFGNILFGVNPNTDGFSILLIAITFILYQRQSNMIYLLYLLLLFQREFAFVIFAVLSFFDFITKKQKYFLIHCIVTSVFFILYYLLRKTIFYTPLCSLQINEHAYLSSIIDVPIDLNEFIRQVILTQNLYFIYFFILLINKTNHSDNRKMDLYLLLVFFIITFILSRIAVANNNMGRYLHMFSPILIIRMLYPQIEYFIKNTNKQS